MIRCWNANGGLGQGGKDHALQELFACCDIVCLTETHCLPYTECFDWPGFVCFSTSRDKINCKPVGGVAMYVTNSLSRHCSVWKRAPDGSYMWVRIDRKANLFNMDVYIAVCYTPPKTGTSIVEGFVSQHIYTDLTADVDLVRQKGAEVLLTGDFNAHTGTWQEYTRLSDFPQMMQAPEMELDELPEEEAIRPRSNQDAKQPSSACWGPELLEMCETEDLLILNWRLQGDLLGQCTFHRNASATTVDYFIVSSGLFHQPVSMYVINDDLAHCTLESDHYPIELWLLAAGPSSQASVAVATMQSIMWDASRKEEYAGAVQPMLYNKLGMSPGQTLSIDHFADSIVQCMMTAAEQCMDVHHPRKPSNTMPSKPYWDQELKDAKKRRKALRKREGTTKQMLNEQKNRFRKLVRAKQAEWYNKQSNKWQLLAHTNPKAFWRAFNKRKHSQCPVSQAEQLEYFKQLVGIEPHQSVVPQGLQGGREPMECEELTSCCLDADFIMEEMHKGLQKMKRDKAAGHDAVISEMILDGGSCLHECILAMFNRMLQGEFPKALSVGLITAVFKKGDAYDMGNYRGITVTPSLAKLFAMLLKNRITEYMESNHLRAQAQAGFRLDHRTVDNVFLMQQLLEHYQAKSDKKERRIYVCFVDFKKAFGTVDRSVLWDVLWSKGIRGRVLSCIKAMYACDSAAVKTKEGISAVFRCHLGVKQGCALSPDLFGIFTDDLEKELKEQPASDAPVLPVRLPHKGIRLGRQIPLLMYADDAALMSTTAKGLQNQLSTLHTFSTARSLTVNVAKTKVMVCEKHPTESPSFNYDGQSVETVTNFKYLGLTFNASHGAMCSPDDLIVAGTKASNALRRRCAEMHILDPLHCCNLFDTLVKPILSYGCAIWVVNPKAGEKAEMLHKSFLRSILRVPKTTSGVLVLAEFGRYPLQHSWWKQILRYQNRMVKLCDTELEHRLLPHAGLTSVMHMNDGQTWCCRVGGWLSQLPPPGRSWGKKDVMKDEVGIASVMEAAEQQYVAQQLTGEGLSSIVRTYSSFKEGYAYEGYLSSINNRRLRIQFSNFRLGNHKLQIQTARWLKDKVQAEQLKICKACNSAVEDEEHVLLHCPHYMRVRTKFADISGHLCVRDLFAVDDQLGVAKFVSACLAARDSMLSKC